MHYPKLKDPVLKAKWVADLRDGQRLQGTGYMCRIADDGLEQYCCLGVLCEVMGVESDGDTHPPGGPDDHDLDFSARNYVFDEDGTTEIGQPTNDWFVALLTDFAPVDLQDSDTDLDLQAGRLLNKLVTMNDGDEAHHKRQYSFAEIADFIEANL